MLFKIVGLGLEVKLGIFGKDVISDSNRISAEIIRSIGANARLYYKDKLITDFMKKTAFGVKPVDKVLLLISAHSFSHYLILSFFHFLS